ncbi:hypothetical protein GT646_13010 [Clostridium butyricum]|nr:hypothetical protein [Clostridium butyricum]MZI81764.1 hypothetical protein [Clostridium butyricum]
MKYRTQKWMVIIRECQASGLSKRMWCKQNNVNEKTFYYWLRKLRQMACQNEDLIKKPTVTPTNIIQPIVPLTVLKDEPTGTVDRFCFYTNLSTVPKRIKRHL